MVALLVLSLFPHISAYALRETQPVQNGMEAAIARSIGLPGLEEKKMRELIERAFKAAERGDWDAALTLVNRAHRKFGRLHPEVVIAKSTILDRSGAPQEALELIQEFLRTHPKDAEAHSLRTAILARLGRQEESAAETALIKEPVHVSTRPAVPIVDIRASQCQVNGVQLEVVPLTPEMLVNKKGHFFALLKLIETDFNLDIERHIVQLASDRKRFDPDMSFAVLSEAGEPIAFATVAEYKSHSYKRHSAVTLTRFSVAPEFQGTAVASWVLHRAFAACLEQGYRFGYWGSSVKAGDPQSEQKLERANAFYVKKMGAKFLGKKEPREAAEVPNVSANIYEVELADAIGRLEETFQAKVAGREEAAAGRILSVMTETSNVIGVNDLIDQRKQLCQIGI